MADEQLPKPDGITPRNPSRQYPTFPREVIYTGPPPAKPIGTPIAIEGMPDVRIKDVASSPKPENKDAETALRRRSEFAVFFCWLAGLFLLVTFGWGFIAICSLLDKQLHLGISMEISLAVSSAASFVFLFILERNLWLSRFMGLRLGPGSTQIGETVFFWVFGVAGLLFRSSDQPAGDAKTPAQTDGVREIVETVVFVVVLVLLLKTFLVEAFVIPTGSMAETLWGYQKSCTCKKCGYHFVINCSSEAEPQPHQPAVPVEGGYCPNCGHRNLFPRGGVNVDPNQR